MARRRGGAAASPAVVGAISTMALVYYSTVFVFLDHWLGLGTTAGAAAHAAAVSLAVAACFLAFVCAAAADPGAVPTTSNHLCPRRRSRAGTDTGRCPVILLSLTIGSLLCWHIYLLCHNMTTIEIMGPNILCWLCPTATGHLKDGTEFQITNN
ncbi:hypothetical protein PR202_ga03313 [Eleusine coracana subsp. coracana]|uniref:Uncharacterized protein n=1 Tax=Eleusine coracana subsp. coracana TaxID=191504 RepID=A0AAV5BMB5_ELECO|nr:hypothetical protein PR202_ga03313 [Eleusine coracana subsp. coracana]